VVFSGRRDVLEGKWQGTIDYDLRSFDAEAPAEKIRDVEVQKNPARVSDLLPAAIFELSSERRIASMEGRE
jgi:hypothetical protein